MSWTKESSTGSGRAPSPEDGRSSGGPKDVTNSLATAPSTLPAEALPVLIKAAAATLPVVTRMRDDSTNSPTLPSAAPIATPELAEVIVKCPAVIADVSGDYSLRLAPDSSVGYLKELLSQGHPCRPAPPDQRLVFRGQLLSDRLQIADMCQRENSQRLVIHMVLKGGSYRCHPQPEKTAITRGAGNVANTPEPRALSPLQMRSPPPFAAEGVAVPGVGPASLPASTASSSPAPSSVSLASLPSTPSHAGPAHHYCGVVNGYGQVVYTDLSRAVLYDGHQFYLTRGSSLASTLSSSGSGEFIARRSHASMQRRPTPRAADAPGPGGVRRNVIVHRINIDLGAIFSFLLRFGIVLLIFSQGGSIMRVSILCVLFGLLFLAQAGLFDFLGMQEVVRRLWAPIVRIREQHQNRQEQQQHDGGDGPAADQGQGARHLNVIQMNPLFRLVEVITTFWLSLFPTEPPHIPPAHGNRNNDHLLAARA